MRKPSDTSLLIGHPIVVLPVTLSAIWMLYECLYQFSLLPIALGLGFAGYLCGKANARREAYRRWKRQWDAMDDGKATAPSPRRHRKWPGIIALVVLLAYFVAHASDPVYRVALVWLVISVAAPGGAALIWKRWGRSGAKSSNRIDPVQSCIRSPMLPITDLKRAYRALPDYCWQVLRR